MLPTLEVDAYDIRQQNSYDETQHYINQEIWNNMQS